MTNGPADFLTRHRRSVGQFLRFALVGASGVLVNMVALILVKKLGPGTEVALLGLPPTAFHVRWYHVYSTLAFLVANLWNFQLNRRWTFRSSKVSSWWREYLTFLAIGFLGQVIGLVLLTLLMHRGSPLSLPTDLLDDSTGFRTRLYWAQLLVIVIVTPLSFVLNKLWTFAAVRSHRLEAAQTDAAVAQADAETVPTRAETAETVPTLAETGPASHRTSDRR